MFGERLNALRKCKGYSMEKLVDIYNTRFAGKMNKSTLSRYENGLQEPIYTVVVNLALLFGVSVDYLSGRTDDPTDYWSAANECGVSVPRDADFATEEAALGWFKFKLTDAERDNYYNSNISEYVPVEVFEFLTLLKGLADDGLSVEVRQQYIIHAPDLIPLDTTQMFKLFSKIKASCHENGCSLADGIREWFGNAACTMPELMANQQSCSAENSDRFKKYRALDGHGTRMVNLVLDEEYERCTLAQREYAASPMRVIPFSLLPASAGTGEWLDDESMDEIEIPDTRETKDADFAVQVTGDSMEPTYHDGDIVLVHNQDAVNVGDVGIFYLSGDGYIKEMGAGVLISHNKEYDDLRIDRSFKCFGKVIAKLER